MVTFTGIGHLHLKVADERSARFYEEGLGMRRMGMKHDGKLIAMFLPSSVDVLTLSEGATGAEVDHESVDIGAQGGIDHFGFALSEDSDLEEAVARLVSAGATYLHHHDIAPGVPTAFVRGPDGYVFQVWRLPKEAAGLAVQYASGHPSNRQPHLVATKRPARRRRLDPHVRREQLLGTALRVVGQLGDCRIEDVTSAARVAKGTFYLYFPSWKHLLVALRQRILEDYAREVADKFARANKETWRPTFEEACIHFVDFVVKLGGLHEALFHGPIADHPINKEQSAPNTLARILHLGMELGAIEAVDIEPCAHLLFSILHSTADAIGQGGDRERFLGCMRKLFCRWL